MIQILHACAAYRINIPPSLVGADFWLLDRNECLDDGKEISPVKS
jgi:hypothetical protein